MTRPLGSTPTAPSRGFTATTSRSAGASRDSTHCLAVQPLGRLPLAANGSVGTRLPTFRTEAADRTHVAYMPDTTWPVSGPPPGSSRAFLLRPGFDAIYLSYDTSTAIPENEDCAPSFRSPPDASRAPFPHRSPRRSSANAACGGLKPPTAGRLRRATPSSPAQHRVKKLYLHRTPLHVRGTRRVSNYLADGDASTWAFAEFSSKWRMGFSHLRGGSYNRTVVHKLLPEYESPVRN
jgi:hypothetical protein